MKNHFRQHIILGVAALLGLMLGSERAFAAGPERSLAGVNIFDLGSKVTAKFGNPSRILVGGVAPGAFNLVGFGTAPSGASPTPATTPFGASPFGASPLGGIPITPGLVPGFPTGPATAFPGTGGNEFPGAPAAPAASATPGTANQPPPKPAVTLIYDRQNGGSLEFTVSPDKRVVQIRETGYTGPYATSRGIKLGMPYSAVVKKYGYPENTLIQGAIIDTDYKDTLHCGFQFLDQKLVAIIVASPD